MRRVVTLPEAGRLIVGTDLQGNLSDFLRVEEIFEEARREDPRTVLVVTGDLVHGPEFSPDDWPDFLGSYYHGDSKGLLQAAKVLQERHPGNVHYLLGNHEHAHVGGPVVSKFFPDEAARLEDLLGDDRETMREWIRTWPFVAIAPHAHLVMMHAAPHAPITSSRDLDRLDLEIPLDGTLEDPGAAGILAALLWARTTSTERAHSFLRALDERATVAVFGHDVARAGFAIDREPLLCVSTSFGCFDGDKLYLDWDLSAGAQSAAEVARTGLRPLHAQARPVYRALLPSELGRAR